MAGDNETQLERTVRNEIKIGVVAGEVEKLAKSIPEIIELALFRDRQRRFATNFAQWVAILMLAATVVGILLKK